MIQIRIHIQMRKDTNENENTNETNTNKNTNKKWHTNKYQYVALYWLLCSILSRIDTLLAGIRYIWNTFKGRKALLPPHCVGNKHFLKGIIWEMMIIIDHWSQLKCFIFVERKPVSDLHLFVSRAQTSKSKHPILEWITFRWESSPQWIKIDNCKFSQRLMLRWES